MHDIYQIDQPYNASNTYDLTFDLSVADMFFTWTNGGTLCVLPEYEKLLPTEYINREDIGIWSSVPTIISFMNDMGALQPNAFPGIERSLFCGEALTKKLADAWHRAAPNSTLENLYGPTEATIWLSRYEYKPKNHDGDFRNGIVPIGKPFPNHRFELIDSDGKMVKDSPGEIVYKGPQVSSGYLNNPEKNASTFVKFEWDASNDIWYKSGDLGIVNNQGDYEFIGRIDNQIKFGGRRVELGEIESTLIKSGDLKTAVVVPFKDEQGVVKALGAFTTSKLNDEKEEDTREVFAKYMDPVFFPKYIISIDAFPQNSSDKIDRNKLSQILSDKINE
jgi:acyl-coenzyme A synthetase/AMP-(fatty) acid ligase